MKHIRRIFPLILILILALAASASATRLGAYPKFSYKKADGSPAVGYKLYTFAAGGSTPKAVYAERQLITALSNPVILDSQGEALFFLSGSYKFNLLTDAGAQVAGWPVDNIDGVEWLTSTNVIIAGDDLATAVATAEATTNGATILIDRPITLAANLVTTTKTQLWFTNSGKVTINNGFTLTLAKIPVAGNFQTFVYVGSGKVTFLSDAGNGPYPVEWWGINGTSDNVAINAAIQAVPLNATVMLNQRPVLATGSQIYYDRVVKLKGRGLPSTTEGGANPGTISIPGDSSGTVINASAVTGVAIQCVATMQEVVMEDFWLYCGLGDTASTVTVGIDLPENVSRTRLKNVRVTGATSAPGLSTGTYVGIRAIGAGSNFSNYMENVQASYNDYGVSLGTAAQQTTLQNCKLNWNYKYGLYATSLNTLAIIACQIEKNGAAAPVLPGLAQVSAGLRLDACDNVDIFDIYQEQNTAWPGAGIIIGGTSGSVPRKIRASGRVIGGTVAGGYATYGVIVNRGQDVDLSGMRVYYFSTANFAANPAALIGLLSNVKRPAYYDTSKFYSTDTPLFLPRNPVKNCYFDKWWTTTSLVSWTQTGGTLSQEAADTGRLGAVCAKLVGAGAAGEVSLGQVLSTDEIQRLVAAGYTQAKFYLKLSIANPGNVTPKLTIGTRDLDLDETVTTWQEVRFGITSVANGTVKIYLCQAGETAGADDIIYIAYAGVCPGLEDTRGLDGEVDHNLYGQVTWDPGAASATSPGITVTGAALGDAVTVFPPYDLQDNMATGYVQAADTVEIRTGVTTDLGSGDWRVMVIKK